MFGYTQDIEQPTDEIDRQVWEQAVDMANRIILIDCHSHDLLKPVSRRFPKQADFEMVKNAGVNGIVQSFPLDTNGKLGEIELKMTSKSES